MGTIASSSGVTLRILDKNGVEQKTVFGKFAHLYSKQRPLNPGSPDPLLGSQDWLTDVLIADTEAKLKAMKPTQNLAAATSQGSRLVLVRWNIETDQGQMDNCITLCDGTMQGNHLLTDQIRVLPKNTVMDQHHPLFPAFAAASHFLQSPQNANQPAQSPATVGVSNARFGHPIKSIGTRPAVDAIHRGSITPRWPSFKGKSKLIGTTPSGRVTVFVDPRLGAEGRQNAQDLLNDADRIVAANDALFGSVGGPVNVIIFAFQGATDGSGGADHLGCDYKTGAEIEVCASFDNPLRVSALFEAELSECSMGGNLCGVSTGEALSRWCAAVISNNALADFATAPVWAQNGMPDYVNKTDPTDQNSISTGCGMAFLSWLMSEGYRLDQIAQEMVQLGTSETLAELFARLTSEPSEDAWPKFRTAIEALPDGVNDDDPFGADHSEPLAYQVPTAASQNEIGDTTPAYISAGQAPPQLVNGLETAHGGNSPAKKVSAAAACCSALRPLRRPGESIPVAG